MKTVNSHSPPALQGFQTTRGESLGDASFWVWMHTQTVFLQSAITGACVCSSARAAL